MKTGKGSITDKRKATKEEYEATRIGLEELDIAGGKGHERPLPRDFFALE